jgi:hypothetical protein
MPPRPGRNDRPSVKFCHMTDLRLHGRAVETVFDLLGDKEDDITYSLGWGLAHSDRLCRVLLHEVFGDDAEPTAIALQESISGAGRTDIELETARHHLILEAKRGWDLPRAGQLDTYAARFDDERDGRILVVSECSPDYPPVVALPVNVAGIPVRYLPCGGC